MYAKQRYRKILYLQMNFAVVYSRTIKKLALTSPEEDKSIHTGHVFIVLL